MDKKACVNTSSKLSTVPTTSCISFHASCFFANANPSACNQVHFHGHHPFLLSDSPPLMFPGYDVNNPSVKPIIRMTTWFTVQTQDTSENEKWKMKVKVVQSCSTLCDPMDYSPWNSPGQNTGVGSLSFLQGIFPTNTGIEPRSLALQADSLPAELWGEKPHLRMKGNAIINCFGSTGVNQSVPGKLKIMVAHLHPTLS